MPTKKPSRPPAKKKAPAKATPPKKKAPVKKAAKAKAPKRTPARNKPKNTTAAAAERRERFCQEYLIDLNGAQAAIRAGYSKKTADQQASRLLRDVKVKARVEELKAARAERTQVNADWLLQRLAQEADADVADLYYEGGGLKPVHEWPEIWRKGLVAGLDIETIHRDGAEIGEIRKLKISDRIKRLELIGRHIAVGAFKETIAHTGPDGGPIEVIRRVIVRS